MNTQNNLVYAPAATKKCNISDSWLLNMLPTLSNSVMVSPAVLNVGCTNLIFIEPAAKINRQYY